MERISLDPTRKRFILDRIDELSCGRSFLVGVRDLFLEESEILSLIEDTVRAIRLSLIPLDV